ncbi:hypothetical protein SISNIDRAFT_507177 [Sistotremastrum niveocremeum HHB9708]|uniref:Mitochondrial chaperone BCS1 n=1 Tax=Sistotremastrum niveocremeum HHB9708 TaxID=1314777 RepID=A0A164UM91_9AGAM|nr:hypothetical protein SISNIDRAFT_507177 [Sistotremastrum niveocremeum HHB9708]
MAGPSSSTPVSIPNDVVQGHVPMDATTPPASTKFGDNPYFTAGFGLMGVGVALSALKQGLTVANTVLRRRMLVSLEIPNRDRSYEWVLSWMAYNASKSRSRWSRSHQLSVETRVEQQANGSSTALFNLVAGTGVHYFKYRGAWMQMQRERETKSMQLVTQSPWETINITTLSKDRELLNSLLQEARDLAMKEQEGKLVIHTAWGTEWRPFGKPRRKRPLHSVVLQEGQSERIEKDIRSFLSRREWYTDRGVPYRRGYLLHGPPGSGKSSYIQALAGSLSYDICLLNLSERGLTDDKLNHLLSNAPDRSFILMEDVDAAFNKRVQTTEDGYQSSVTFSGFLNALDGVASGEQRIVFLTTNHLERLDAALVRPGRVDVLELFDDASPRQARELYERFYSEETRINPDISGASRELELIVAGEMKKNRRLSMASLQGHFIRNEPAKALATCSTLFRAL